MNYFLQQEFKFYSSGNKYIFQDGILCFGCTFHNLFQGCIKSKKANRLKCHSYIENIAGNYNIEKYK